jgi:hypothetical protein
MNQGLRKSFADDFVRTETAVPLATENFVYHLDYLTQIKDLVMMRLRAS